MSEPTRDLRGVQSLTRMVRPAAKPAAESAVEPAPAPAASAPAAAPANEQPAAAATTPAATTPAARPSRRPQRPEAAPAGAKRPLHTRVRSEVGDRARVAYRFAGHLEGVASFAEFVEQALVRETGRYEKRYNDGAAFGGALVAARLPGGTPRVVTATDSPKESLNTRVPADVSDRARAAFLFAGHIEGVASFAEFVEDALERAAERYEKRYNDGEPFDTGAGSVRLPGGRPLRR